MLVPYHRTPPIYLEKNDGPFHGLFRIIPTPIWGTFPGWPPIPFLLFTFSFGLRNMYVFYHYPPLPPPPPSHAPWLRLTELISGLHIQYCTTLTEENLSLFWKEKKAPFFMFTLKLSHKLYLNNKHYWLGNMAISKIIIIIIIHK